MTQNTKLKSTKIYNLIHNVLWEDEQCWLQNIYPTRFSLQVIIINDSSTLLLNLV